jgi:hypothetical protein
MGGKAWLWVISVEVGGEEARECGVTTKVLWRREETPPLTPHTVARDAREDKVRYHDSEGYGVLPWRFMAEQANHCAYACDI